MEIFITEHAFDRGHERLGLSKNAFKRLATRAFERGLRHEQLHGRLRRWIDGLMIRYNHDGYRIYGEVLYVFIENRLVTSYQVPNELRRFIKMQ